MNMINFMKTYIRYISVIILLCNIFYLWKWIDVFNKYKTQQERVISFLSSLPFGLSINAINSTLLILSVFSIYALLRYNEMRSNTQRIIALLQSFFVAFYLWQNM